MFIADVAVTDMVISEVTSGIVPAEVVVADMVIARLLGSVRPAWNRGPADDSLMWSKSTTSVDCLPLQGPGIGPVYRVIGTVYRAIGPVYRVNSG
jgi:hypothetical protein